MSMGRVLVVAGSDSGGGAGIQADIKAITALKGYAATAVTALTAQNTLGVHDVMAVPEGFIRKQMEVVLDDIGTDAIKTGMLHRKEVVETVVDVLEEFAADAPLVVDPVMVAKGGARLLDHDTMDVVKARLILKATLLTPNIPEAEALTGLEIHDVDDMKHAAEMLLTLGPQAVLMKGGHLPGDKVVDILIEADDGIRTWESPRVDTRHTHGTGCTLASAISAGLARGLKIRDAVGQASAYVHNAIISAPGLGQGHGPLNHSHAF